MQMDLKQVGGVLLAISLSVGSFPAIAQEVGESADETPVSIDPVAQEGVEAVVDETPEVSVAEVVSQATGATVYLIREKKFVGGGRDVWVAVNDRVAAELSNGSHVAVTVRPGLNSVHAVQAKAGFAYAAVDNRDGESVYLKVDYLAGVTTELSAEEGEKWVRETKPLAPLAELRPNDAYDNLLINPDLLGLGLMETDVAPMAPDAESAVITFYRPGKLIAAVPFAVWSTQNLVGSLMGNQYFQVRVSPGKHTFVGFSERLSVLNATVEAGKEYAVELDVGMGWNQAHIKLLPMNLGADAAKVEDWKQKLSLVGLNAETLQKPNVAPRITTGFDYLASIKDQWAAEAAASRALEASEGR